MIDSALSVLRVHYTDDFSSGDGFHVKKVIEALDRYAGVERNFACLGKRGSQFTIKLEESTRSRDDLSLTELREVVQNHLDENSVDIIHLHSMPHPKITELLLQFSLPVVRSLHEPMLTCPGWSRFLSASNQACQKDFGVSCMIRAYSQRCQRSRHPLKVIQSQKRVAMELGTFVPRYALLTTCSDYMIKTLLSHDVPAEKISKVPSPQNASPPSMKEKRDGELIHIVFAGRVSPQKGINNLIAACQSVADKTRGKTIKLSIIGEGESSDALRKYKTGTKNFQIDFHGWLPREEVWEIFSSDCIVVVPSIYPDCFPNVVAEAMACGAPVIASDAGGTSEWFDDNISGLSYSSHDVAALTEHILDIGNDPATRSRLGENGKAKISNEHNPKLTAERYLKLYENILASGPA